MNPAITKFNDLISETITLIEKGNLDQAQKLFNENISPEFGETIWEQSSPLNTFMPFFCELEDYLNNKVLETIGVTDKERILDLYYGEYKEEVKKLT